MDVSVKKLDDDSYEVKIGEKTITLPAGSTMRTIGNDEGIEYGLGGKFIQFIQGGDVFVVDGETTDVIAPDEDGVDIAEKFALAWGSADTEGGRRRSRLNRKAKRTKRNRRNLKRSKLRKLTTRRR